MQIDIRILIPLLSILSLGSLFNDLIKKRILRIKSESSFLEQLAESLVFGTLILVIPMICLAWVADRIGNDNILETFVYVYLAIGLLYLVYKIYMWVRRKLPDVMLAERKKLRQTLDVVLILLLLSMLFFYTLQVLVYPLKGWDFLHFYLPNSFRLFITGQLSQINELTFIPQFKPPMNVFLFAYTFFVTQAEMIQLVPLLFLAGTVYYCYRISILIGLSKKTSLFAVIALLATPLTFFLVYEFIYYQEIFIMFFVTAAFYYYKRFLESQKTKTQIYYVILTTLSLSGCVLSKLSGFIIPLVLFVAMPSDKLGKILRSTIVIGFAVQLIRKSIFDIYLGTGIFIGLLAVCCVYFIITSESLSFSWKRWIYTAGILVPPTIIAVFWGLIMVAIPGVSNMLQDQYFNLRYTNVSLDWPGIYLPDTVTYLENAHTATFLSSSFSILIASMFAGTWMFVKLVGFVSSNKKYNDIVLWALFFFMFWQGIYAMDSIRYLVPLLVPITIIFTIGFESIVTFLNSRDDGKRDGFISFLFITATAYLSIYPVLPIETVFESFHLRWYYAHTHLLSLVGYILILNGITFLLLWKEEKLKLSFSKIYIKKMNFRKIFSGLLIFIIGFVPFSVQFVLLSSVGFDLDEFQSEYTYDYRYSFQELVDAINRLGYTDDQVVLSINTPGLEYYASQPVLDLFMIDFISESGLSNTTVPFWRSNITRTLEFLEEYDVSIFVALNSSNDWFSAYVEGMYWNIPILRFLHNNQYFTHRFSNEEFLLFTVKKYDEYVGPVDVIVTGESTKASLLDLAPLSIEISDNQASIGTLLDLTYANTILPISVDISAQYYTSTNQTTQLEISNYELYRPENEIFTFLPILNLPDDTVNLLRIDMTIEYTSYLGYLNTFHYHLKPSMGPSVNISRIENSWYYAGYNGLIFY
ncbi:MAG: glycosyltransferase family 39 protein [Candidatus Heimdallarchaeota archaeon]|nr:glycosyltransferase family 39 protein [Candidatus Heimdallarchaeota archaeon]